MSHKKRPSDVLRRPDRLRIGIATEAAVTRVEPTPWFLTLTTLYGADVYHHLAEAVGLPELGSRLASP